MRIPRDENSGIAFVLVASVEGFADEIEGFFDGCAEVHCLVVFHIQMQISKILKTA